MSLFTRPRSALQSRILATAVTEAFECHVVNHLRVNPELTPKEGVGEILILTRIMGFHSLMKLTENPIYNILDILSELLFSKIVQQYKMC